MTDGLPTEKERILVARCMLESGTLIGSQDEIWTHPSAYRALITFRLVIDAISLLVEAKQSVYASFVRGCVMQTEGITVTPFMLDDIIGFLISDQRARAYWDGLAVDRYFPHRCPHCSGAAFVGFLLVECKSRCEHSLPRH